MLWRPSDPHTPTPAAVEEAKEKAGGGDFVLIDVRPRGRHEEGRISDAVSVPLYQRVPLSLP
jgi:rhodanese-related sulfurtransferase